MWVLTSTGPFNNEPVLKFGVFLFGSCRLVPSDQRSLGRGVALSSLCRDGKISCAPKASFSITYAARVCGHLPSAGAFCKSGMRSMATRSRSWGLYCAMFAEHDLCRSHLRVASFSGE